MVSICIQKAGKMYNETIRILHCGGGWPTNIGNAFIDFGIRYLIISKRKGFNLVKSRGFLPLLYKY